jgi:hypothetical protein
MPRKSDVAKVISILLVFKAGQFGQFGQLAECYATLRLSRKKFVKKSPKTFCTKKKFKKKNSEKIP